MATFQLASYTRFGFLPTRAQLAARRAGISPAVIAPRPRVGAIPIGNRPAVTPPFISIAREQFRRIERPAPEPIPPAGLRPAALEVPGTPAAPTLTQFGTCSHCGVPTMTDATGEAPAAAPKFDVSLTKFEAGAQPAPVPAAPPAPAPAPAASGMKTLLIGAGVAGVLAVLLVIAAMVRPKGK